MGIVERAELLLDLMKTGGRDKYTGEWLQAKSGLSLEEVNETVAYLENTGKADTVKDKSRVHLYDFIWAWISVD